MAAAATEARLSGRVLRRKEPLGVSGRGLRRSRRPGRTRPRPGPGEGPRGGQGSGHFWVQPALALHPRSRGLRTSEGERARVSCQFCHETRTPEPEKACGPVIRAPRERGTVPFRFQTFPYFFPARSTSHRLGCTGSDPMGRKLASAMHSGKQQAESFPRFSLPSRERRYKRSFFSPEISCSCHCNVVACSQDCIQLFELLELLVYLGCCDSLEQDSLMVCELLEIVWNILRICTFLRKGPVLVPRGSLGYFSHSSDCPSLRQGRPITLTPNRLLRLRPIFNGGLEPLKSQRLRPVFRGALDPLKS